MNGTETQSLDSIVKNIHKKDINEIKKLKKRFFMLILGSNLLIILFYEFKTPSSDIQEVAKTQKNTQLPKNFSTFIINAQLIGKPEKLESPLKFQIFDEFHHLLIEEVMLIEEKSDPKMISEINNIPQYEVAIKNSEINKLKNLMHKKLFLVPYIEEAVKKIPNQLKKDSYEIIF